MRYTQEEWDELQLKLKDSGLTYSQFMRQAMRRSQVIKYDTEAYASIRETRLELKRIGININNIARQGAMIMDAKSLDFYLHDLLNCRDYAKSLYERLEEIEIKIKPL